MLLTSEAAMNECPKWKGFFFFLENSQINKAGSPASFFFFKVYEFMPLAELIP